MSDTPRTDALPDYMDATALRAAHAEMERILVAVTCDLDEARALNAAWAEKAATWMASPEAAARLQGYRDMGKMAADAENERDALRAEIDRAIPAMRAYAAKNPTHLTAFGMQDPNGVHAWLSRNDKAALTPAEVTK